MEMMTKKPHFALVSELVQDTIKYATSFLVIRRKDLSDLVKGFPQQGVAGQPLPIAGYFRADPKRMRPYWSADGRRQLGWEYGSASPGGKITRFNIHDVVHIPYNVQPGALQGSPIVRPVLDDVRAYRQCEEYVIRLLFKHLTPLLHHEVPDNSGIQDGPGRQVDVDLAAASHATIAVDGLIVTPPGHKIQMIGAESRSLRGEGYMSLLKQRVYTGLGVSATAMGEGAQANAASADAQTTAMHNKAKFYQATLAAYLTTLVLNELLMEGGFDPMDPDEMVRWVFEDFEIETRIKVENHESQLYSNGLKDQDESRRAIGLKPLDDQSRMHLALHQIPLADAQAAAKAAATPATPGSQKQAASRSKPSNQHGTRPAPKVRPK
jgi:hypothetical protein